MSNSLKYLDIYSYDPLTFRTKTGVCCSFILFILSFGFFCIECYDYLPRALEKQGYSVEVQMLDYFGNGVEIDTTIGLWQAETYKWNNTFSLSNNETESYKLVDSQILGPCKPHPYDIVQEIFDTSSFASENVSIDLSPLLNADQKIDRQCFWLDQNLTGSPHSPQGNNVWISFIPCTALPSGSLPKGQKCKNHDQILAQMNTYRVNITLLTDDYFPDTLTQKAQSTVLDMKLYEYFNVPVTQSFLQQFNQYFGYPEPLFLNFFGIVGQGGKIDDPFSNPNKGVNKHLTSFRFYAAKAQTNQSAFRPHRSLVTVIADTAGFFFGLYIIVYPCVNCKVNSKWGEYLEGIFGRKVKKTCCCCGPELSRQARRKERALSIKKMLSMLIMNRELIKDKLDENMKAKWEALDDSEEYMDELAERAAVSDAKAQAKAAKKFKAGQKSNQTIPEDSQGNVQMGEGASTGHMPSDNFGRDSNMGKHMQVKGLNFGLDDLEGQMGAMPETANEAIAPNDLISNATIEPGTARQQSKKKPGKK